ncbi:SRPBCC family protein [Aquabacter sp. CN5-332]|uniref:SRPBCC family protein n=1 Tax=Aquabacter sp. CN5-332 TaxID=3156608 RepID=UPI0032B5BA9F
MSNRIEKTLTLKAPVEKVWRALTDHEAFGQWFRVKLDRPFEPGEKSTGRMLIKGFEHVRWNATIKQMEEPRLFSFTWHPYAIEADVDYSAETPTLVEFRLEPAEDGTKLTVTETGFDALPAHRRPDAFRMNDRGWGAQMENVRAYVEGEG